MIFSIFHILKSYIIIPCIDTSILNKEMNGYKNIKDNFYLSNCFFKRNTIYDLNGGIIFLSNIIINGSIEKCTFYNCSSQIGGAIYMSTNLIQT